MSKEPLRVKSRQYRQANLFTGKSYEPEPSLSSHGRTKTKGQQRSQGCLSSAYTSTLTPPPWGTAEPNSVRSRTDRMPAKVRIRYPCWLDWGGRMEDEH